MHTFTCRVYYEDTDLAGVVYHANYLKFMERGRSEWLRDLGLDQRALKAEQDLVFMVTHIDISYRRPAYYDDLLRVETQVLDTRRASIIMMQKICRDGDVLTQADVTVACVRPSSGKAMRLPIIFRQEAAI